MTNLPPQRESAATVPRAQRRQVALPGSQQKQRRNGLLLLGLLLVFGAGFGFWLVLRSINERAEYLVAAQTIERWEVAQAKDFTVVEANVGKASALTVDELDAVLGKWATGRIPAGTLVTEGLFESPPLSGEDETDKVLIQVRLPSGEAPFGTLSTGDTVALLGRESAGVDGQAVALGLIGVLRLEFVQGDDIYYVVTPEEALEIKSTVDRYTAAADRTMLKLGFGLTIDDLVGALQRQAASVSPAITDTSIETGSGPEPVGDQ